MSHELHARGRARGLAGGLLMALASAAAAPAQAQTYAFTDLGSLGPTGTAYDSSAAAGIDNAGDVVVNSRVQAGESLAFRWSDGTRVVLPAIGGNYFGLVAAANGIDDGGSPYGSSTVPTSNSWSDAVRWDGASVVDLGASAMDAATYWAANFHTAPPDPTGNDYVYSNVLFQTAGGGTQVLMFTTYNHSQNWRTDCVALRAGGAVVGSLAQPAVSGVQGYEPSCNVNITVAGQSASRTFAGSVNYGGSGGGLAALWDGTGHVLASFPSLSAFTGINATGHAVGNGNSGGAWFWNGGALSPLAASGSAPQVLGINASDRLVGTMSGGRAALWTSPTATAVDLNDLAPSATSAGWTLVSATGINDSGWIVGTAFNPASSATHAFLLKPLAAASTQQVPMPGWSFVLLGGGLAFVVMAMSRRRAGSDRAA